MNIDANTEQILSELESCGFEAYMVGGCVRDGIMGRECHDIDITTNALPQQMLEVFRDYRVIPTGIKHGTVTVLCGGVPFEITTYRIDGEYTDHRRPDKVEFTSDITADLARRDFTVNAIAMDKNGSIIDPFGGKNDIEAGIIRCVGEPEKRFTEDALRIMRAVRFSSQLGFEIDENTAAAVHRMKDDLKKISRERIREELDKLICGKNCIDVLLGYSDVITAVIPEFQPCIGLDQRSPYHKYTVWEHIVRSLDSAPCEDILLRRALFFHDIGKPACMTLDENGRGHFKKHDNVGAEMTRELMRQLKYDNRSIADVSTLIANHSKKIRDRADVKKMMSNIGDELFFSLMVMKKCDNSAKNEFVLAENVFFDKLIAMGHEIISNNECRNIRGLAVKGTDLAALGFKGAEIGGLLHEILGLVIEGTLDNNRTEILKYAEQRCRQ
ncbi:CCA tRNA nucleotidyltransferase [Ruminococcus flavefaciens]|uniref:tRNA nucleotidyltransferase (CCA-adding enzyme) n=1 Tax=Ruminococcus flavefaciens TaxID=1265 RepID=A0A1M7JIA8_RUMFL|nr:CCA tRNA nucleotidyltransferase [Ruminococcus flavefaciens]SHM52829.1 tRNA nucleotidyltransferase (CCA-adding enzyme) [Ruminococcus flavefaciens]